MSTIQSTLRHTFAPLKNKNLSIYLSGQLISVCGTMMQQTAQSWVVWKVSGSTASLGITVMLASAPMLVLGAIAGVWADRYERRKILIGTQAVAMLLAFAFALLVQTEMIQLWHIYTLAALLGCITALDLPAQSAFISDLAGTDHIRGAVTLNNMLVQVSRTVGPALAGIVIAAFGASTAFWLNGASFLFVIGTLLKVRVLSGEHHGDAKPKSGMGEVIAFVKSQPRIIDLLVAAGVCSFFAFNMVSIIPAIVTDYLHADADTLGLVTGASGAGALIGALIIVPLTHNVKKVGWVVTGCLAWLGIWFSAVAYSESTWFWFTAMLFGSMGAPVILTTANGLTQTLAPVQMRARVISLFMMVVFGVMPFGALLVGFLGKLVNPQGAIFIYSLAMFVAGVAIFLIRSGFRNWRVEVPALAKA